MARIPDQDPARPEPAAHRQLPSDYEDARLQGLCHDGAREVLRRPVQPDTHLDPDRP